MNFKNLNIKDMIRHGALLFIIPLTMASCSTTRVAVDSKDLSYLYNPTRNSLNPLYNIRNESDHESILSIKLFTSELYFSEANTQGVPLASILVTAKLFTIDQGRVLADTSAYNLTIYKENSPPEHIYQIPLDVDPGREYLVEVKILDRVRMQVVHAFLTFNTLSDYNRYNFRAQGHFRKNDIFKPILKVNEYVDLIYLHGNIDTLFLSYYEAYEEIPYPPSLLLPEKTLDYLPDTIIALPYSDTIPLMLPRKGIFLFSAGRDINDGYTFLNLGDEFPSLTTPEVMIEPLVYIASETEMKTMHEADRSKLALDNFWIKCGGNIEKARELIRIYYTRVYYANQYFTSFTEGWRTDRGMIYIIYGPPDKVYKSSDGESWGYLKPVIKSSWGPRYRVKDEYLFFIFRKRNSIFTDNDFYLSRSETLVTLWDQAVASWRKGIVFRLDNPEEF
jgi:GWxTD domain-containing protein